MIAIVDYGMGNLHSVAKAVERLGYQAEVVEGPDRLQETQGIILPGVGAFGDAMEQLKMKGMDSALARAAASDIPLLGICLGMQLLFESSEEHGRHQGLGFLRGQAARFQGPLKVPHMGWNRLSFRQKDPLFEGMKEGFVYFVHSYHVIVEDSRDLLASSDYGHEVAAIVGRKGLYGMQFHPEKSGAVGMQLLKNFLGLCNK
ncbi:imidazole glycerol phosphate synthase subunit HisH [Paenibacillus larvae]|uniref:Imidazole glycerol phosphate synthase subunit HisH n=1 Tax=Paenibacillus larvae subsp. larvae TaxID=147375 RepID=A0A6C0QM47_9BACL|nr:imidazole glycerol phosphate synthase subunit HisH [Paenibacillus larvae]MCY7478023.1 imidazole glycerol phosphate synthase subunit HisH [Paenibacillus larvae]MDE5166697.1 imidazole glycerol phosphate synthase subunit HisH [Paenibacillus larvae subsp. larvae]MDR5583958.1 imidazole glycerol phosphate synthase subunit HisH [Paenibacillus larvae]MDR5598896.1 imidazole glycerol phosphate synthase subunit HisH [Paenibacillus larvae]QHZ49481.1 imidazole glycerol phosphate synthase subunit HisH [P